MSVDNEAVLAVLTLERGLINPLVALDAVRTARQQNINPLRVLVQKGAMSQQDLVVAVAAELGIRFVDLFDADTALQTDQDLFDMVDLDWFERFTALPLRDDDGLVVVATVDPINTALSDYCADVFGRDVPLVLAPREQINQILLSAKSAHAAAGIVGDLGEPTPVLQVSTAQVANQAIRGPVLSWLDTALASAISLDVSDLHFELDQDRLLLARFRIDNELVVQPMPLRGREMEVISAFMSRAGMDPANLREPQDGSFSFTAGGRNIDVRAGMIPLDTGPKLVLRLLDPSNLLNLRELGFQGKSLEIMRKATSMAQGLIVTAGPTGSGKTTTLYAMVQEVASPNRNVMTVEDPIEYRLPFVSQIPVRSDLGERSVTFERALRTILRLDPDVILVGEVRDSETARVSMDAALTGHLVLTTIHAPSAVGVFVRFIEMGVPPYLVSEALTLSISQRLVRRVHTCAQHRAPSHVECEELTTRGITPPAIVAVPVGCGACGQRGYRGRVGVAELCAPDAQVRRLVAERAPLEAIQTAAEQSSGYVPLTGELQRLLDTHTITVAEAVRALATGDL